MKKKASIYILIISILLTIMPYWTVHAKALTTEEMKIKIAELKETYKQDDYNDGKIWNGNTLSAEQCMGFAVKVSQLIFGEDCRTWYVHGNVDELCVGDHVRYRSSYWNHSITVIDIVGDTVHFIDCNGSAGANKVGYSSMTKQELTNKINQKVFTPDCELKRNGLGYIQTQPNNWIKTLGGDVIIDNGSKWRVTATDGINIRSGAGTGYSKIGALAYNTYFYITERKQADGYIWGKTDSGWVALNYAEHVSGPVPELDTDTIEAIHKDTIAHVRNGYCTIKNVSSGKFMNVYAGIDDNYTSVCMWAYDDSTDQHFRLDHKGDGKYKLYAYCSSRGTNRVVDVCRGTDAPAEGDKIHLWTPDDDTSQLYYIWPVGDNEYVFELASKNGYVIAPNGSGDAASDGAQLTLQRYTGEAHQKWSFCDNNGNLRTTNISYAPGYYTVNTNGFRIVRRSSPDPYADVLSGYDINDGETFYVSQVSDFWGYTEYNGVGGWVCLDYTKSTVVLDSISISSLPDKTTYFVGEQFDSLGLRISANYSNGQSEEITQGFSVSCDINGAGTKQATVTYKGKSVPFNVEVYDIFPKAISIQENNLKKIYTVGDTLDTTGLALLVEYNNGKLEVIEKGFDVDYDFSTPGTKTVTVSYGGKTTSCDVNVLENQEEDKAVWTVGSATCYVGEEVVVPVILSSDNICDGNITFQYDSSKLEIVDFSLATQLSTRNAYVNTLYDTDKIRVSFAGTGNFIADNEKIISFRFKALDTEGSADIKISDMNLYSSDGLSVNSDITNGTVTILPSVANVEITNIQSTDTNGQKIVTADVSNENVICYLAAYDNNRLTQCDIQKPVNGKIELCVSGNYDKFILMVWDLNMKPLMNTRFIY